MRNVKSFPRTIRLFLPILLSFLYTQGSSAQQVVSPVFKWKAEADFVVYTNSKFKDVAVSKLLAFERTVSLTAIPLAENPVRNVDELAPGKVIGALYLSTGSTRLNLPPGSYTISVAKENAQWRAKFMDRSGGVANTVPAKVEKASSVNFPVAFVDQSICYRFDETIVCI